MAEIHGPGVAIYDKSKQQVVFKSFPLRWLGRLTWCSETLEPDRSSACRRAVPQTSERRGSVPPSCHTDRPLHTDPAPALAQVWACLPGREKHVNTLSYNQQ